MRQTVGRVHRSLRVAVVLVLFAGILTACEETVSPEELLTVATVAVTPKDGASGDVLNVGDSLRLGATAYAANGTELTGRPVIWESAHPTVAAITPAGVVRAVAPGSARIIAEVENKIGEHWVHVAAPAPQVASVQVSPAAAILAIGQTQQYTAVALDANGLPVQDRPVAWSAEPAERVSITTGGVVTALAAGYAQVTATIDGVSSTVALTVPTPEPPPTPVHAILIGPANPAVVVGSYLQLDATPIDLQGNPLERDITWSSDNESIAMVGVNGLVLGVARGAVLITATSGGVSNRVLVEVRPMPSWPVDVYELAGTTSLRVPYIEIGTTTWRDANGQVQDAFLVVRGGTLTLNYEEGTYEQKLEVATYRLNGQPTDPPVRVQNVTDHGDLLYDFMTGYYLFESRTRPGTWWKVTVMGAGEFVAPQSVLGKPVQQWVWVVK